MTDLVQVSDENGVRLIRMNRADKKNALNAPMYDAMADAIERAAAHRAIRCLMIAGAPGAFCAGNDLKDFQHAARHDGGLGEPVIRFLHALAGNEKPLVAAVQGVAVGIGTTMLLHCDYVVAGTDVRLSTPFVSLGLLPEAASSLLMPRLIGHRRAFALLVMGQPLDADAAKECGLVNAMAAPAEVDELAMAAALRIAQLPPDAVALSRQLMRGSPEEVHKRIEDEAEQFRIRLRSDEARAALDAFFARKK
ncbi:MAG: crotonase/enoyl-CoA hydratase family protein [Pseudorhodoplanes sp.]|nr:Short-chain-enoyl-CoA hydratase [Pseudorhodoplanes sp.]MBW7948643.1 crotonase/enoyl-CoA hydratase family protein [Pseudorhodoplanes sp.]MCL4711956.1 crotonase/enoyl-CoA hydratase family protein [Pseudorhodoplanes sp.]MCQ3943105.1 crotonase/enoyl-CoA hydratase family protein [Alphaproteobacteria bacterium]GIK83073.1 MAG: enoyl-CoA hydratase [Alphaproteobacteria bacterium]